MTRPTLRSLLTLAALGCLPPAGAAEPGEPMLGWHIVREGENLIHITDRYLGDRQRWREIWKLNSEIENPHFLRPGQRVRVLREPSEGVPSARVVGIAGRVEEKPLPLDWGGAQEEDLLVEKDGVRTHGGSSIGLQFSDGTGVVLTEDTLVYLQLQGRVPVAERRVQTAVEIVVGQADVEAVDEPGRHRDIEIVVGGARATPRAAADGRTQARARRPEDGGARVMLYEGEGDVEAAGGKVSLIAGTGTAVPEGAPPGPPEQLLAAPRTVAPEAGARLDFPDPLLEWREVPGASSYTVEVCVDPDCVELVRRATGVSGTSVRPAALPVADLHWRATAVSTTGLDGYPSPAVPFAVTSDRPDDEGPVGELVLEGPSVEVSGRTYFTGETRVRVRVRDAGSGVGGWRATIDGRPADPGALLGPWETGPHAVEVTAEDRRGNRSALPPLRFVVDGEGPEIEWRLEWVRTMLQKVRPGMATREWRRRKREWAAWARDAVAGSASGPAWLVVAWGSAESPLRASYGPSPFALGLDRLTRSFTVTGDEPELIAMVPGLQLPGETPLHDGRYVWIAARDRGVGEVVRLDLATVAAGGGYALRATAEDRLGNVRTVEWPFAP